MKRFELLKNVGLTFISLFDVFKEHGRYSQVVNKIVFYLLLLANIGHKLYI